MTREQAAAAIRAILAAVPDDELPKPKIEKRDGETIAWFGGLGRNLGSAKRGGVRRPENYRDDAVRTAFENEATYRLDLAHLATEATQA